MKKSEYVVQYLPYLRRYARALTGSQSAGDTYVEATLEALLNDPKVLNDVTQIKTTLFRMFTIIWNSIALNTKPNGIEHAFPLEMHLQHISARPRQAFLLSSLEDFPESEIATILECSAEDVASLIKKAGEDLSIEIATDVLIIEDEPLIAMELQTIVEQLCHRVIDIATTEREAVSILKRKPFIGLILADIQLADGSSGLDAVNHLTEHYSVPVIFITAYPERFLTGKKPEPAFLISKPFRASNVSAVLSQALFFHRHPLKDPSRNPV